MSQVRLVALPAKASRAQRDALLGNVAEEKLGEPRPARGEYDPAEMLGFEPLSPETSEVVALHEAVAQLSDAARAELYALMRTGQGHLAARKWYSGVAEAKSLGKDAITVEIVGNVDLHDHVMKGLYETRLVSS